jgi:hypothetical protein
MTDAGYESSTANNHENIASSYAEIGDEEATVRHYMKCLEVQKMTPLEERNDPFWYQNYFNTFGTMCAYAGNIPSLKETAKSMASDALTEFDYNIGSVATWVSQGLFNEALTDSEAIQIAQTGLDKLDLSKHEEKWAILNTLRELYGHIHDKDDKAKDKCITLLRECAEDDESKKDLEDWLKELNG